MPVDAGNDVLERHVAALFDQYRGAVFAYVVRLSRDPHLAEEVTQETFFKIFKTRERLPGVENERAWIFRVATNTYLSVLRRRNRWQWLPWEAAGERTEQSEHIATDLERRDAVEQALDTLDDTYRVPLLLFGYHGFSVAEIALILGISEGAVKTRVYRAKKLFLKAYEQSDTK